MEEKAADELDRLQGHGFASAVVSVILPLKGNLAIFEGTKPVDGDGHSAGIRRRHAAS